MSWYADIIGDVETSLQARPMAMRVIGQWTKPKAEGKVVFETDRASGKLQLHFHDCYRNLGRYLEEEIWNIAQKYPKQTQGQFFMSSTDGGLYFAQFRVADGKLYRRMLAEKEDEIRPYKLPMDGKHPMTAFLSEIELARFRKPPERCGYEVKGK